jgi:hypothetical protein
MIDEGRRPRHLLAWSLAIGLVVLGGSCFVAWRVLLRNSAPIVARIGPPRDWIEERIADGDALRVAIKELVDERGRLPEQLRGLRVRRPDLDSQLKRSGSGCTWMYARLGEGEYELCLKRSLSWASYDCLVWRSDGFFLEEWSQQALEVRDFGAGWRLYRGAEDVATLPSLDLSAYSR